ncbi:MAG: PQQ-dependent sugar dehydrogenase [Gemmatimonadetes bacterium]|nr:PQQ-dependent sugar dehydrogenase [Gemmatimonadota bacterium]
MIPSRAPERRTLRMALVAATLAAGPLSAQATPQPARGPGSLPPRPAVTGVHFSARHDFRVDTIAFFDHPWSIAWLPSGDMLVTERPGRLRIVREGKLLQEPVAGVPKVYRDRGQGGLMEVVPHPDFATNHLLYLSYARPTPNDTTASNAIVRGRLEGDRLVDVQEILVANGAHQRNNQFAGKMLFDASGYLYLAVGDRQFPPQLMEKHPAQDLTNDFGTIVRLHDDGRIPADNPFVGRTDVPHEIWSWGHRNAQGFTMNPATGELWETEHGPRGGDELNLVLPARNYGWPLVSYGVDYDGKSFTGEIHRDGMESPRWVWIPSIAASGLAFYTGERFPWWKGSLFSGGLEGQVLVRMTIEGHEVRTTESLLIGEVGRIRDVRQGPDGLLYLAIDPQGNAATPVVRLVPVAGDVLPPPR